MKDFLELVGVAYGAGAVVVSTAADEGALLDGLCAVEVGMFLHKSEVDFLCDGIDLVEEEGSLEVEFLEGPFEEDGW